MVNGCSERPDCCPLPPPASTWPFARRSPDLSSPQNSKVRAWVDRGPLRGTFLQHYGLPLSWRAADPGAQLPYISQVDLGVREAVGESKRQRGLKLGARNSLALGLFRLLSHMPGSCLPASAKDLKPSRGPRTVIIRSPIQLLFEEPNQGRALHCAFKSWWIRVLAFKERRTIPTVSFPAWEMEVSGGSSHLTGGDQGPAHGEACLL